MASTTDSRKRKAPVQPARERIGSGPDTVQIREQLHSSGELYSQFLQFAYTVFERQHWPNSGTLTHPLRFGHNGEQLSNIVVPLQSGSPVCIPIYHVSDRHWTAVRLRITDKECCRAWQEELGNAACIALVLMVLWFTLHKKPVREGIDRFKIGNQLLTILLPVGPSTFSEADVNLKEMETIEKDIYSIENGSGAPWDDEVRLIPSLPEPDRASPDVMPSTNQPSKRDVINSTMRIIAHLTGDQITVIDPSDSSDGLLPEDFSHAMIYRRGSLGPGSQQRVLRGHTQEANLVELNQKEKMCISGSSDMTFTVCDIESGTCLQAFESNGTELFRYLRDETLWGTASTTRLTSTDTLSSLPCDRFLKINTY
ncbi:hypothetical protein EDB80DRAFT_784278 [Ilyonectria destructans]|nr:hypothetical protein EDB80DRAFT_784278 [Ilyonectria destructans]